MTVTLRPMTPAEFEAIISGSFENFVGEMVKTGGIAAEDAPAEIARRREQNLPGGLDTPHMLLFIGEVDGERIGWLWIALPGAPQHAGTAWIYNIEVDEAHRGKGYGKDLMLAAERELIARGVDRLGLNVFGANTTAIGLYTKLGYQVIAQQMSKPLSP